VSFDGQDVSPEGVSVEPAFSACDLQQPPRVDGRNTVLGRQTSGVSIVGNKEALKLSPDDYSDGLCLAEVLGRRVSGAGKLISQYSDILVLGLVREEWLAENLCDAVQCS
jgi:hypothetical protein